LFYWNIYYLFIQDKQKITAWADGYSARMGTKIAGNELLAEETVSPKTKVQFFQDRLVIRMRRNLMFAWQLNLISVDK
jgi:hypothetical protein